MPTLSLNPAGDGYFDRFGNLYANPLSDPSSYLSVARSDGSAVNASGRHMVISYLIFDVSTELDPLDTITNAELTLYYAATSSSAKRVGVSPAVNYFGAVSSQAIAGSIDYALPSKDTIHDAVSSSSSVTLDVTQAIKTIISDPDWSGGYINLGLVPTWDGALYQDDTSSVVYIHGNYSGGFMSMRPNLSLTWTSGSGGYPSGGNKITLNAAQAGNVANGSTVSTTDVLLGGWEGDTDEAAEEYNGFARFTGLNIPQGSTINSARVVLSSKELDTDGNRVFIDTDVHLEDADNSATTVGQTAASIDGRSRTTAFTNFNSRDTIVTRSPTAHWVYGHPRDKVAVDVTSSVQEVVDRAGWSSGNAMTVLMDSNSWTGINSRAPDGSFSSSYTNATYNIDTPVLEISWGTAGAGVDYQLTVDSSQSNSQAEDVNVIASNSVDLTVNGAQSESQAETPDVSPSLKVAGIDSRSQCSPVSMPTTRDRIRTAHFW